MLALAGIGAVVITGILLYVTIALPAYIYVIHGFGGGMPVVGWILLPFPVMLLGVGWFYWWDLIGSHIHISVG